MLISMNNLLATRDWWVYGRIKKYLRPIKNIDNHEFYDIIDVEIVEELEKKGILRKTVISDKLKKGEKYRIDNIVNMIELVIPTKIDILTVKKEIRKHMKKLSIKFKNHETYCRTQIECRRSDIISHLRHQHTNYEDIIYNKINDLVKIGNLDKNKLVKKIKDKINNDLIRKFHNII